MWYSVEILVPALRQGLAVDFSGSEITVLESSPPISHRGTKSRFQSEFEHEGGYLFHLGDPLNIKVRDDRYYVYDALEPPYKTKPFCKFLPIYRPNFSAIVEALAYISAIEKIWITTDVWLGPKTTSYKSAIPLERFLTKSEDVGLKWNSIQAIDRGRHFADKDRPAFVIEMTSA